MLKADTLDTGIGEHGSQLVCVKKDEVQWVTSSGTQKFFTSHLTEAAV